MIVRSIDVCSNDGVIVHTGFSINRDSHRSTIRRASVLPFQKGVNSVSGFANSVFYRLRFAKFRFLPFQIFKILLHFFQAVFLLSIIFFQHSFSFIILTLEVTTGPNSARAISADCAHGQIRPNLV